MQVNGIEAGHDENPREQAVDIEAGVDKSRDGAGAGAGQEGKRKGREGIYSGDNKNRGYGSACHEASVNGNVGKVMDAESDKDTHCHEGIQDPEVYRADPEFHRSVPDLYDCGHAA